MTSEIYWWKVNDGSGNCSEEVSSNTLTVDGATWTTGGNAWDDVLSFDGVNDEVVTTTLTSLADNTVGSISFWIKWDDNNDYNMVYYIGESSSNSWLRLYVDTRSTNNLILFDLYQDGTRYWRWVGDASSLTSVAGTWVHCIITQNGTSPKIYINGSDVTSSDGEFKTNTNLTKWLNDIITVATTKADTLKLGNDFDDNVFYGKIQDVRFYNVLLTQDEIDWLYNSGNGQTTSLSTQSLSWLSGWDYRREITIDNSGNANTLTNYQIEVNLTSDNMSFAHAMSNGEDIRFTKSDGTTELDFWIKSYDSGNETATIWVEVDTITGSDSDVVIYMYYGKSGESSASSGSDTFILFDDFTNGNNWTENDPESVLSFSSNKMNFTALSPNSDYNDTCLYKSDSTNNNFCINLDLEITDVADWGGFLCGFTQQSGVAYLREADDSIGFWIIGDNSIVFRVFEMDDGTEYNGSNYELSEDTVYELGLGVDDTTAKLIVDGTVQDTHTLQQNHTYGQLMLLSNYERSATASNYKSGYMQNFRVRNYNLPEPSNSVGSEESGEAATMVTKEENIIHWWKFNEEAGSPSPCVDSGATGGIDLTKVSSPAIESGGINENCYHINTYGRYYRFPTPPVVHIPFSFSFWVQAGSIDWKNSNGNAIAFFINKNFDGEPIISSYTNNSVRVYFQYTNVGSAPTTPVFTDPGTWHHIVAVYDSVNPCKLYWEGNEIYSGQTNVKASLETEDYLELGVKSNASGTCPNILIDDFRVYNIALTQDDVTAIYNGGLGDYPLIIPDPTKNILKLQNKTNILPGIKIPLRN